MSTNSAAARTDYPESGMLLMAGAMLLVPSLAAMAKVLGPELAPVQIAFIRFLGQTLVLGGALAVGGRLKLPHTGLGKLALSGAFMAGAIVCLFWSMVHLPIANAHAIFFVEPLILTLLSVLFLGERIGKHRLGAVVVGLAGAMVVIRPNWMIFGWAAILPFIAAFFYAAHLAVIRNVTTELEGLEVQAFIGGSAAAVLGVALLFGDALGMPLLAWTMPAGTTAWTLLAALGPVSALGYLIVTLAFKRTPASTLAPFQYFEIISATVLGYLLFAEFPDAVTWLGTAIILAAGAYIYHRERRLARAEPDITIT